MEIYSLKDYLRIVNKYRNFGAVYRGISNKSFNIFETTFERASNDYEQYENEFKVFTELFNYFNSINVDKITQIQIARHYGLKCRFLDFSEDPLISLYFACKENNKDDAKVIIFDRVKYSNKYSLKTDKEIYLLNDEFFRLIEDYENEGIYGQNYFDEDYIDLGFFELENPVFLYPIFLDNRINFQRGIFLVTVDHLNSKAILNNYVLESIIIPSYLKVEIIDELNNYGYTKETIENSKVIFLEENNINPKEFADFINKLNEQLIHNNY